MKNLVRCHVIRQGKSHQTSQKIRSGPVSIQVTLILCFLYILCWVLMSVSSFHPFNSWDNASIIPVSQLCSSLITSPPTLYNSRSNGKSSRSASGTSHLKSSWCAIIIAVMLISSSNTIVSSRHWSEHARPTDQENGGRVERITVFDASVSDIAGMLIDLGTTAGKAVDGWLVCPYIVWHEAAETCCPPCILLYSCCLKSWLLFFFNIYNIVDSFGNIQRLKKNLMKPWKALQRPSKCSLASSTGSMKFQS